MAHGRWARGFGFDVVERRIALLGAASPVGVVLSEMLTQSGWLVTPVSRHTKLHAGSDTIPFWVSVAPIWVLPEYFSSFSVFGAKRIVALSSTSRWTKIDSVEGSERRTALRLADSEERLASWAAQSGTDWIVLRPTLIYGMGHDRNICEIVRFIRRFGFFPVLGKAAGLRQPIHVEDVAKACQLALETGAVANRAYDISGGEVLSYREMVTRVFATLHKRPRLLRVPRGVFGAAVRLARLLPRFQGLSIAMADRMNTDMVFDHREAASDLGFAPRAFSLTHVDTECS